MKVIMCIPVEGAVFITEGSTKQECQECGQPVWVAPSSLKVYDITQDTLACIPCVQKMASKQEMKVAPLTESQIGELKHHGIL